MDKGTNFQISFAYYRILIILGISILYSIIRYHVFGNVGWSDLPIFILNKGISLTSLILLTINFSIKPLQYSGYIISNNWNNSRKTFGRTALVLAIIHVIWSCLIFNPIYFEKFFNNNSELNTIGIISVCTGIISLVLLLGYHFNRKYYSTIFTFKLTSKVTIILILVLLFIHVGIIGYDNWLKIQSWQGYIPPITLVSCLILGLSIFLSIYKRDKN